MKRVLFILSFICFAGIVSAQSDVPSDTIRANTGNNNQMPFGEFLIDMNLLTPPRLPEITPEFVFGPIVNKDYNSIFQPDLKWIATQGSIPRSSFSTSYPLGWHSGNELLQISTFTLKNNTRISLYGQYNADGWHVPDRSALPWDKNKFVGGMEVKFNNGFSFRLDVRKERNPYFPY